MDKRRLRRLYVKQLEDTGKYLAGLLKQPPFSSNKERFAQALADGRLVDALEEILSVFAIYGVARDLERLKPTRVLFLKDPPKVPAKTLPPDFNAHDLNAVLPLGGAQAEFKADDDSIDQKFRTEKAYERYFDWYIDPCTVWQKDSGKTGVDAFNERYPLLDHAVKTVTDHYQKNIQLACQRVNDNWVDIQSMFFPGRTIEKLLKIQTTGNDFHKGGKQVLILTFSCSDGSSGRVVYKPSAVEIDCRIVGDSAALGQYSYSYKQEVSLTELVNKYSPPGRRLGGYISRPLPTYKILPYNWDSVPHAYNRGELGSNLYP